MIDEILEKARQGKELSDEEFLELLNIEDDKYLEKLFKIAYKRQSIKSNQTNFYRTPYKQMPNPT